MSVQPTEVVKDFIQNIAPDKLESAARRLVAEDATYISLNFENAELKQIMPYTGTSSSPEAFIFTFSTVLKLWKIEEFTVTDIFSAGEDVAVFGSFTLRSVSIGKVARSPFAIHAKVRDGKIVFFQFYEDTFATARSFSRTGTWTIKTDPNGSEYEV